MSRIWASLVAQWIKNLPEMQETWVQFLGQEDSMENGMATHSSILAWRIPWTEEPGGLYSMQLQRVRQDWTTNMTLFHSTVFQIFLFLQQDCDVLETRGFSICCYSLSDPGAQEMLLEQMEGRMNGWIFTMGEGCERNWESSNWNEESWFLRVSPCILSYVK